jgi:hypothetical protein
LCNHTNDEDRNPDVHVIDIQADAQREEVEDQESPKEVQEKHSSLFELLVDQFDHWGLLIESFVSLLLHEVISQENIVDLQEFSCCRAIWVEIFQVIGVLAILGGTVDKQVNLDLSNGWHEINNKVLHDRVSTGRVVTALQRFPFVNPIFLRRRLFVKSLV